MDNFLLFVVHLSYLGDLCVLCGKSFFPKMVNDSPCFRTITRSSIPSRFASALNLSSGSSSGSWERKQSRCPAPSPFLQRSLNNLCLLRRGGSFHSW